MASIRFNSNWSFQQSAIFSAFSAGDNAMLLASNSRGGIVLWDFLSLFTSFQKAVWFSVSESANSSLKNSIADWCSGASVGGVILVAQPAVMSAKFLRLFARVAESWVGVLAW
ncbi:hypothetical protein CEXT_366411, partial [Caerostris extrusa]